jgi:pSer/pThr/pTyr-binding forkhead associated (FHA) protein
VDDHRSKRTEIAPLPFPILQSHRVALVIRSKDRPARIAQLESRRVTIGRDPENHIVLDDDRASRFHVELELSVSGYRLRDTSSTNGTLVNGALVSAIDLSPGDVITVGSHRMEYVVERLGTTLQRVW